jgi:predicted DNA binding protein
MARAQGREGSARLALVKNRMRAEIEKRKAAAEKAKTKTTTSAASNVPDLTPEQLEALVNSIEQPTKGKANANANKNKGKGKK